MEAENVLTHDDCCKLPNFFLLGAGRCGTTSLHYYLKSHPSIFLPNDKEPSFFIEENNKFVGDPISYFNLFSSAKNEKRIGESSHAYLSNPSSARVLHALFPDAVFLVILRDPAERAYSLYHWMRRNGYEYAATFEKALALEDRRYSCEKFRCNNPQYFYNYMYFRSGLYGEQLERYFSIFGKQQFHVIEHNQFFSDPEAGMKRVFRFLGVDPYIVPTFGSYNAGKNTASFPRLLYFLNHSGMVRPRRLRRFMHRFLCRHACSEIEPLRPDTRAELNQRFASDQKMLSELCGFSFQK